MEEPWISRSSTQATAFTGDTRGDKPRLSIPMRMGGRDRSPGLQWGPRVYSADNEKQPRCLLIDYMDERSADGEVGHHAGSTRRVFAQELHHMHKLKKAYHSGRPAGSTLRVFHVQNWTDASRFLIHAYRLHDDSDLTGQPGFADWILQKKPQRRAGKPLLLGKTWKVSADPWRGVSKCAVGLDYLKRYPCPESRSAEDKETRVHGLKGYDANDNPVHRYDVYSQRMSMYVQLQMPDLPTPGSDLISPYGTTKRHKPSPDSFDNGNVIIVFDGSDSGSIRDTLLPARGEMESRWRRLPFYLPPSLRESTASPPSSDHDVNALSQLGTQLDGECMRIITQDVFRAVADGWDSLLDAAWEHVSILETRIYEEPADESRAPELWKNSANWLKYERLILAHSDAVADLRKHLVALDGDASDAGLWLPDSPGDFKRLTALVEEDLVKRTSALSDLMYKSVGIRDSRQSLQLGTSMWRLSWITFIFLPLTFLSGFFGMNVDAFAGNPAIGWYFVAAAPFMLCVLLGWYLLKHRFARSHPTPLQQRAAYDALFDGLHRARPDLWTRQGPREYVQPATFASRVKWRLVNRWTAGKLARPSGAAQDVEQPRGAWNRTKRFLIRRWTREIELVPHQDAASLAEAEAGEAEAAAAAAAEASFVHAADGAAAAANGLRGQRSALRDAWEGTLSVAAGLAPTEVRDGLRRSKRELLELQSRAHSSDGGPSDASDVDDVPGASTGRNSGVLVEERDMPADGTAAEQAGELRQEHPADSTSAAALDPGAAARQARRSSGGKTTGRA